MQMEIGYSLQNVYSILITNTFDIQSLQIHFYQSNKNLRKFIREFSIRLESKNVYPNISSRMTKPVH